MSVGSDLAKFEKSLKVAIKEVATKKAMKAYAKRAIELIRRRTRNGFGVDRTGQNAKRLASLRPATKDFRKRNSNLLHPDTSPGKSNLTFTGQLLDSLVAENVQSGSVVIRPNKRRRKGGLTNQQLAGILEKPGKNRKARPFLNLSRNEIKKLEKEFSFTFDKALKKAL